MRTRRLIQSVGVRVLISKCAGETSLGKSSRVTISSTDCGIKKGSYGILPRVLCLGENKMWSLVSTCSNFLIPTRTDPTTVQIRMHQIFVAAKDTYGCPFVHGRELFTKLKNMCIYAEEKNYRSSLQVKRRGVPKFGSFRF